MNTSLASQMPPHTHPCRTHCHYEGLWLLKWQCGSCPRQESRWDGVLEAMFLPWEKSFPLWVHPNSAKSTEDRQWLGSRNIMSGASPTMAPGKAAVCCRVPQRFLCVPRCNKGPSLFKEQRLQKNSVPCWRETSTVKSYLSTSPTVDHGECPTP